MFKTVIFTTFIILGLVFCFELDEREARQCNIEDFSLKVLYPLSEIIRVAIAYFPRLLSSRIDRTVITPFQNEIENFYLDTQNKFLTEYCIALLMRNISSDFLLSCFVNEITTMSNDQFLPCVLNERKKLIKEILDRKHNRLQKQNNTKNLEFRKGLFHKFLVKKQVNDQNPVPIPKNVDGCRVVVEYDDHDDDDEENVEIYVDLKKNLKECAKVYNASKVHKFCTDAAVFPSKRKLRNKTSGNKTTTNMTTFELFENTVFPSTRLNSFSSPSYQNQKSSIRTTRRKAHSFSNTTDPFLVESVDKLSSSATSRYSVIPTKVEQKVVLSSSPGSINAIANEYLEIREMQTTNLPEYTTTSSEDVEKSISKITIVLPSEEIQLPKHSLSRYSSKTEEWYSTKSTFAQSNKEEKYSFIISTKNSTPNYLRKNITKYNSSKDVKDNISRYTWNSKNSADPTKINGSSDPWLRKSPPITPRNPLLPPRTKGYPKTTLDSFSNFENSRGSKFISKGSFFFKPTLFTPISFRGSSTYTFSSKTDSDTNTYNNTTNTYAARNGFILSNSPSLKTTQNSFNFLDYKYKDISNSTQSLINETDNFEIQSTNSNKSGHNHVGYYHKIAT